MMCSKKRFWIYCCLVSFLILFCGTHLFAQGETIRVSVSSDGAEANDHSKLPSTSNHGWFVAFETNADNLVTGDTNGQGDIFVHNRLTGETERVSINSLGEQAAYSSYNPFISADGRYVVFESAADNLVSGDTNMAMDIFLRDRLTDETERVSINSLGQQANAGSRNPSITPDGRYVVFDSAASNLAAGDGNGLEDVFVRDRVAGQTIMVSVSSAGVQGVENSWYPSISDDGRYVAFYSHSDNLVPGDTNHEYDVFVHDILTGETVRASVSSSGTQGDEQSKYPRISGNGRYVSFHSYAGNLVPDDTNFDWDIFVHDLQTEETIRASVDPSGGEVYGTSRYPVISQDGRYVAFQSTAKTIVPNDKNNVPDIFVHDMLTGENMLASVDSSGNQAIYGSDLHSSISPEGKHVAFTTMSDNLVPGDTNNKIDTFLHSFKLAFIADAHEIPEAGGAVNFDLDAGAANMGRNYIILGSITGTDPGTPLPGGLVTLPLNWDVFTDLVIDLINTPVFMDFLGVLDGSGQAAAQMNVPALPSGLVGLWMYFAFALANPYDFVSNPEVVVVVP